MDRSNEYDGWSLIEAANVVVIALALVAILVVILAPAVIVTWLLHSI